MRLLIVGSLVSALLLLGGCATVDAKLKCTNDTDCHEGYGCDSSFTQVCLTLCSDTNDCLALQYCDVPVGQVSGLCRDGNLPADGADSGGGDPGPTD